MEQVQDFLSHLVERLKHFFPDLLAAALILVIGIIAIKLFRKFMTRLMRKKDTDPTVLKFTMDLMTWILRILLFIIIIGKLGVPNMSFVAILGAAGLAIGLSLQGSLSNFAGGLLIILMKPVRVGDYIEAQGESGTVAAIQIFNTKLITPSNQVIYLPNGALSNGNIKNFSKETTRRADITLGVGYDTDLKKVKDVIKSVIESDEKILKQPDPIIHIKELADNSINILVLIWSNSSDYGQMVSDFYENIKAAFDNAGIEIPYPQRDIHIRNTVS